MNTQIRPKARACRNDSEALELNNPKRRILKRITAAFIRDSRPRWWTCPAGGTCLSKSDRIARDGFSCVYCGLDLRGCPPELTTDHLIPRCVFDSFAEANQGGNLTTCCWTCNQAKADWFPETPTDRAWLSRENFIDAARAEIRRRRRGKFRARKWCSLRASISKPSDS